jgi:hypothetical protein
MVIFPSTGEVMVVKFDTGGYWASVKDESANKRKRLYMVVHSCFDVGRSEGGGREVVEGDGRRGRGGNCLELLLLLRILSPKAQSLVGLWKRRWMLSHVYCISKLVSYRQSLIYNSKSTMFLSVDDCSFYITKRRNVESPPRSQRDARGVVLGSRRLFFLYPRPQTELE